MYSDKVIFYLVWNVVKGQAVWIGLRSVLLAQESRGGGGGCGGECPSAVLKLLIS